MATGRTLNDLFPSKYLKADDLGDGDLVLTITSVAIETMNGANGSETKPVLYFSETEKKLVLNKTNAEVIAKLYGNNIDEWEGKRIQLYSTEVNFSGKVSMGIRVRLRPPQPAVARPRQQTQTVNLNAAAGWTEPPMPDEPPDEAWAQ